MPPQLGHIDSDSDLADSDSDSDSDSSSAKENASNIHIDEVYSSYHLEEHFEVENAPLDALLEDSQSDVDTDYGEQDFDDAPEPMVLSDDQEESDDEMDAEYDNMLLDDEAEEMLDFGTQPFTCSSF